MFYVYTYTVWWVVLTGLVVEGVVYFVAWRRSLWSTVSLTVGINIASALGGGLFSLGSLLFLGPPILMISFIYASPVLVFAITVAAEYVAGTRVFSLPRSWKTASIIALANVPSVGLAIYETMELTGKALTGGA